MTIEDAPGEEPEPLPELLEAFWPREQVAALFDDLKDGADVTHVQLRRSGRHGIQDSAVELDDAKAAFLAGEAIAIQVKYCFEGQAWCDTILPQQMGAKVVRCPLPEGT